LYRRTQFLRLPVILGTAVIVCLPALGLSRSSELEGQEVRLRPHTGLYRPTRISAQNGVLHLQQRIGVVVGARLTVTFNDRFDVVTGVSYIPAYVTFHRSGERLDVGTRSHSLSVTTRAQYWLFPPSARMLSWEVHTSLGLTGGGQSAYKDLFDNSTITGIVGTAVRYQIGRIVSLTLRVQERLYRIRLGGGDVGRSRSPLDVSFGVGFPFLESLP
jgi:hypothetical protein